MYVTLPRFCGTAAYFEHALKVLNRHTESEKPKEQHEQCINATVVVPLYWMFSATYGPLRQTCPKHNSYFTKLFENPCKLE